MMMSNSACTKHLSWGLKQSLPSYENAMTSQAQAPPDTIVVLTLWTFY